MNKLVILISMFLVFSCVKSENDKITSGSSVITTKEYSACSNSGAESSSANYLFSSNGTYKILIVYYDANNCSNGSAREMNFIYGQYSYNASTSKMTERSYKLEIAYLTNAEVTNRNNSSDCGYSDWAISVFKNVTDNSGCAGGTIYSNSTANTYDAVLTDLVYDDGQTIYNRVP